MSRLIVTPVTHRIFQKRKDNIVATVLASTPTPNLTMEGIYDRIDQGIIDFELNQAKNMLRLFSE